MSSKDVSSFFLIFAHFTDKNGPFSRNNFHPQKEKKWISPLNLLMNVICTELFRDIISHFVSGANISQQLEYHSLFKGQNGLNTSYTLLRDMCKLMPHKNGWGNPPDSKDKCVAACIERIKIKIDEITAGRLRIDVK